MRKTAIVFLLMSFVFVSAVDIKNIRNKTNSQLMGNVVDGTTEADANYLEDWIGNNLKAIIDFTNESRHRSAYQTLSDALTDSTGTTEAGIVLGKPNYTDTLRDTTAYLTGKMALSFPNSYKIDWRENRYRDTVGEYGDVLFHSSLDTNLTIIGGEFYGHSDDNYIDGSVAGLSSNYDDIYFDGVNVAADSLVKWYIHILSGTGSGQTRRITSNLATAGGSTLATVGVNWVTRPNSTSTYRLTPMEEYQSGFDLNKNKQVYIANLYIHDFPGDGISIGGCEDVVIDNCKIIVPFKWFYQASATNSQCLVGRQGITISGGTSGNWYDRPGTTRITGMDTLRNIRITRSHIRGGYPGGIDLEPLGRCYIENLEISECTIENTPGQGGCGIIVALDDSSVVKNLIIRDNLIKSDGTGIWLQNSAMQKLDSTTVSEAIDATEYAWDVANGSIFSNDDYIVIGNDAGFHRISSILGNTITLYNSGGARTAYNGVANTTHLNGTKVYRMSGMGSDYGHFDNVQIVNNTIVPHTPGLGATAIYVMGAWYHNLRISGNLIKGWRDRGLEITGPVINCDITHNRFYDNATTSGLANNFYGANAKKVRIEGNIFKDNGKVSDSSGVQLYLSSTNQLIAVNNLFVSTEDSTIARGLYVYNCDSVIVSNNISYGHTNDDVLYYATTNARIENNTSGFSTADDADSLSADVTYDYGTGEPGDTTAALHIENKRITMNFKGYRDSYGAVTGAKIVMKSTGEWSADDPWRVQKGHLEFYTLDMLPLGLDRSRIRALITGKGMGMPDSSYICFFPANSATVVENTGDADSLWKYVNSYGYGLRELGGKVQFKHSGGTWADIGSGGSGSGDVTGPASSTDNAIVRFDGATGKTIQSNQYVKMLDDGTTGWGLGTADPVCWITVNPTVGVGVLVTDEKVPAMTDSCSAIGVISGAGYIDLYSGNGNNSRITVDNSDYMYLTGASAVFVQKKASGCLTVTSENVFTGLDSTASIYTYLGNGALMMMSASGMKAGIIYQTASDGMRFINADQYKFSSNIVADAGIVFNQKTADLSAGTGMYVRNVIATNPDTLMTRDGSGNVKRWISDDLYYAFEIYMADDGTYDLPSSICGHINITVGDVDSWADGWFKKDGTVFHFSDYASNIETSDVDAKFCFIDNGSNVRLKNRLGSAKYVKIKIIYSTN